MSTTVYSPLVEQILQEVLRLPPVFQKQILDFTQHLAPKGVAGKELLRFAGSIPDDDLALMAQAIDAECERVDIPSEKRIENQRDAAAGK